jgi:hypothetical protein
MQGAGEREPSIRDPEHALPGQIRALAAVPYQEAAENQAKLFLLSGHDDGAGVFANMGLPAEGRKPYFAFSTAILVINSVVGGSAVAIALGAFADASLGIAAGAGAAVAILSAAAWLRFADRLLELSAAEEEPLFPSP